MPVPKHTTHASGIAYAVERMQHLLNGSIRRFAMQFAFAAEIQAQATLLNEARQKHAETAAPTAAEAPQPHPFDMDEAPAAPMRRPAPKPQVTEETTPAKRHTTTELWRNWGDEKAQPTEMLSVAPEALEWNEVAWVDFAALASEMATGDLLDQLFQLAYEQAKRLLDSVSDGGRQNPPAPVERALVGALAEAMAAVTGRTDTTREALKRLEALDAETPLYAEKVVLLCGELFLEQGGRLPEGVTPEALQIFLELVMRLARNRLQALAPDGSMADERRERLAREKAYKQYLLQDFRGRMRRLLCPDAEDLQDEEAPAPSFTYEEEQLTGALQRLCDERLAVALSRARTACKGLVTHFRAIDERISAAAANWSLMRLDRADRALLRTGAYELAHAERRQPPALVINEAVEMAKSFGKQDSPAFVNGVLERIRLNAANEAVTFGAE